MGEVFLCGRILFSACCPSPSPPSSSPFLPSSTVPPPSIHPLCFKPPLSSSTLSPLLSSLQTLGSGERSKPASAVSSRTVLSPGERVVTQVAERARSGLATGDKNRHSSPVHKHCPHSSGPAPVNLPSEAKAALSSSQDPGIRPSGRRGRPGRRNWPGILNLPEQRLVQECPKCLVKIHIPRPGKGTAGKPEAGSRGMHWQSPCDLLGLYHKASRRKLGHSLLNKIISILD